MIEHAFGIRYEIEAKNNRIYMKFIDEEGRCVCVDLDFKSAVDITNRMMTLIWNTPLMQEKMRRYFDSKNLTKQ